MIKDEAMLERARLEIKRKAKEEKRAKYVIHRRHLHRETEERQGGQRRDRERIQREREKGV